ncbi:sensor histidine kinase [Ornithinicoccus hortensis]|uniref:histidine kinase n=1 Tax=Ornithinicoccus hortensis TaxID=82346 RepID=A0A542YNI1_9MICO|nr:histidine kinase [Ornithinicoccus hortensis]TQL49607.1 signal transduction histidine kinase [Ornithinicoccus hortensis]
MRLGLPATTVWGETWRVLLAIAAGALAWIGSWLTVDMEQRGGPLGWLAVGDPVIGALTLVLMLFRRRWPLAIALLLTALSAVSVSAAGASAIAVISMATRRRWREVLTITPVFIAAAPVWDLIFPPEEPGRWFLVTTLVIQVLSLVVCVSLGYYIGVRRDNITALRERAESAEREQGRRVEQARATERARIAREMHDVLAHRISLIAMHSGILAYRDDLPAAQVREIAATLRDNADQAVSELREVLGVLRGAQEPDQPLGPQPDLTHLGDLIEDLREGGTPIQLNVRVQVTEVPETISRHAYRIVQEGLTNARKHAPGMPVSVALAGGPVDGLEVTVVNQPAAYGVSAPEEAAQSSGSGLGLLGLAERAVLSGGRLSYGNDRAGRFTVRAWLPWGA